MVAVSLLKSDFGTCNVYLDFGRKGQVVHELFMRLRGLFTMEHGIER